MRSEEVKQQLAKIESQLPSVRRVTNEKSYLRMQEDYKLLKENKKIVEAQKKSITDPLNETLKQVRKLFRNIEDRIEAAEGVMKSELEAYMNARENERRKKTELLEKNQRITKAETRMDRYEEIDNSFSRMPGSMTIDTLVITDPGQIPDEYWILDEIAIKQALKSGTIVPGAAITKRLVATSR